MTNIYRVYDKTTDRPSMIFEASSDDVACRAFSSLYPSDVVSEFSLIRLCTVAEDGVTVVPDVLELLSGKPNEELDDEYEVDNATTD